MSFTPRLFYRGDLMRPAHTPVMEAELLDEGWTPGEAFDVASFYSTSLAGPQGPPGERGPAGPQGDSLRRYHGAGPPPDLIVGARADDEYLDTNTFTLYVLS